MSTMTPSVYDLAKSEGRSGTKFRLRLVVVNNSGDEQVQEVARIEREGVEIETLGLTLAEGKLLKRSRKAWSRSRSMMLWFGDTTARSAANCATANQPQDKWFILAFDAS
jgi:hypothetical protein